MRLFFKYLKRILLIITLLFFIGIIQIVLLKNRLYRAEFDLKKEKKITIPFYLSNDYIILTLKSNGQKLPFILDTAADSFIFNNTEYYNAIKKNTIGFLPIIDINRTFGITKAVKLDNIELDNTKIKNPFFKAINKDENDLCANNYAGIIGKNIITKYIVKIDYHNHLITFYNNRLDIPDIENLKNISLTQKAGHLLLPIQLHKKDTLLSNIDLGSNVTVTLNKKSIANANKVNGSMRSGIYGTKPMNEYIKDSIKLYIDKSEYRNIQGYINTQNDKTYIGNSFFKNFDFIILDWKSNILNLSQNYKSDFHFNKFGFNVTFYNGKTVIKYIVENSIADNNGLRVGDEIISINGSSLCSIYDELRKDHIQLKTNRDNYVFTFKK